MSGVYWTYSSRKSAPRDSFTSPAGSLNRVPWASNSAMFCSSSTRLWVVAVMALMQSCEGAALLKKAP